MAAEAIEKVEKIDPVAQIGFNAGSAWQALNGADPQTVRQIQQATKLPEAQVQQAIGWLAREGKLAIREEKGQTLLSLK